MRFGSQSIRRNSRRWGIVSASNGARIRGQRKSGLPRLRRCEIRLLGLLFGLEFELIAAELQPQTINRRQECQQSTAQ